MKGIILAGGRGTRLFPVTQVVCKQLLPVFDKPMIYYPLATLMYAGIQEILIISTPEDLPRFHSLFGDGAHLGLSFSYIAQEAPEGIAQALILADSFVKGDCMALILGDNIFYGHDLKSLMASPLSSSTGATIFGYEVKDPERYGVIDFDPTGKVLDIIEKPEIPPTSYAVTGLYFYDNDAIEIAKSLKPSKRGELEITDVNLSYLRRGDLEVRLLGRGFAWLDTGTHDALHKASNYVQTIQERQGIKIACLEEIALNMGFINEEQFARLVFQHSKSEYGTYLKQLMKINAVHV
ncbi:MAG: glucose-1-phosphate thymidylyltransferase RfbA [Chlamydiota bacterium]